MEFLNRIQRLRQIAEDDRIYQIWEKNYAESSQKFHKFAKWCPKKIRQFLYGYAESGRLMMQRAMNIACEQMVFPDEKQGKLSHSFSVGEGLDPPVGDS